MYVCYLRYYNTTVAIVVSCDGVSVVASGAAAADDDDRDDVIHYKAYNTIY